MTARTNIIHMIIEIMIIRISKWTFYRGNDKENTTQNSSRHQQMKESISMGQIQATGNYPDAVPAKMLGGLKNGNKGKHSKYNILFSIPY